MVQGYSCSAKVCLRWFKDYCITLFRVCWPSGSGALKRTEYLPSVNFQMVGTKCCLVFEHHPDLFGGILLERMLSILQLFSTFLNFIQLLIAQQTTLNFESQHHAQLLCNIKKAHFSYFGSVCEFLILREGKGLEFASNVSRLIFYIFYYYYLCLLKRF